MEEHELQEIYRRLAEPLPVEGIQRTKGSETRRGYDTTGYGYQFAVNRFNEVCGLEGWGYSYTQFQVQEGAYRSGAGNWSIVVEVTIWVRSHENARVMPGSHTAGDYGDAFKGAITNGFKKAAAMWGVGRQAYEGVLDEDNRSAGFASKELIASLQRIAKEIGADLEADLASDFEQAIDSVSQDAATSLIRRYNQQRQKERK